MSSPDWRKEKEVEIASREQTIQQFPNDKSWPEGELYRSKRN
ncbi:MAG: hypothetical protein Ct9H300mP29_4470 [Candidatus Neomarinimicrobiota bacterium]|nr:MAG: hypothetical protein Ct9H300mP29_4470 [Candidatus Neomarinimicrobiota bacterium]